MDAAATEAGQKATDDAHKEGVAEGQQLKKEQETVAPSGGGLQGGGTSSTGDQDWLNRWADEVDGDIPANPENAAKAKALNAKGIYAKARTAT